MEEKYGMASERWPVNYLMSRDPVSEDHTYCNETALGQESHIIRQLPNITSRLMDRS
jgi:hypothetical protein